MSETWDMRYRVAWCGPLELRAVRDEDLPELVDAATAGVHDDRSRPFPRAWTALPPAEPARDRAGRITRCRAHRTPSRG